MSDIDVDLRDFLLDRIIPHLPPGAVRSGDKYNFRCPFCGDSKRSMTKKRGFLYLSNATYHCFNCETDMNGFKFASALEGIDANELKKEYVRMKYGRKRTPEISRFSASASGKKPVPAFKQMVKPEWKKPLTEKARAYLDNRMVTSAPFLKEPLYSYIAKNGAEYILIPWTFKGAEYYYQLNDFQRLNSSGMKYIFPKNSKKGVYGLDGIVTSFPFILLFEGVYDSMFVKNGVCIGGKSLSEYQKDMITSRFPRHQLVMCLDNDVPGLVSAGKNISKNPSLKYFMWFSDSTKEKDINDLVLSRKDPKLFSDPDKVRRMIMDPILMKMFLVKRGLWGKTEMQVNGDKGEKRQSPIEILKCQGRKIHSVLAPKEIPGD